MAGTGDLHKFAATKRKGLPQHARESVERIKAFFGRSELFEGGHKAGCTCGFCKNKGNIGSLRKGKKREDVEPEEPEEPKDMAEGIQGEVKLSKGSSIGSANKAYHNMTSKQAMSPGFKPKAYIKAAAEVAGLPGKDQVKGFKNKSEGEMTGGRKVPKTRRGESVQRVVAALIG